MWQESAVAAITDASFDREVLRASVPTLVVFWTAWSPACAHIVPLVQELAQAHAPSVRTVQIELDTNPMLATHYRIQALPVVMLFHQGKIELSREGLTDRRALEALYLRHGVQLEAY